MNILRGKAGKLLATVVATIILLVCLPLSATAQVASIILDPTPVEVVSGDTFTVTLKINDVPAPGMAAYDFKITFTPGVIEFDTAKMNHDWPDPDFSDPFAFDVDNAAGWISFNDILGGAPPHPSGDITLVVLHGTATFTGSETTPLHFDKADIMDFNGDPISATSADGEVREIAIGAEAFTVNKLAILAPWIALAVVVVGGISWLTLRRRRAES